MNSFIKRAFIVLVICLTVNTISLGAEKFLLYHNGSDKKTLPCYLWTSGCVPTSAAMALGYRDNAGYVKYTNWGKLIEYYIDKPALESYLAHDGYYYRWEYSSYNPERPKLILDLAIAMNTDGYDGGTFLDDMVPGVNNVTNNRGYGSNWATWYPTSVFYPTRWTTLKGEIDNNRPLVWVFETTGGGGHAVTVWGYEDTNKIAYCYNTWDEQRHDYYVEIVNDPVKDSMGVLAIVPQGGNGGEDVDLRIPDGGQAWEGYTTETIKWYQYSGTSLDNVDIYYSKDGGKNWSTIATWVTSAPGWNSYNWTIPNNINSSRVRIKIRGWQGGSSYLSGDGSQRNFTITPDNTAPTIDYNGVYAYGWYNSDPGNTVNVDFSDSGSGIDFIKFRVSGDSSWYTLWNGNGPSYTSNFNLWLYCGNGEKTIDFWARDLAGNNNYDYDYLTYKKDTISPSAPVSLNATPSGWTNNNSFSINWTNPSDPSGIAGAYYKRGSAPTSNSNYDGYTTNKPFSVSATSQGGQKIYVWLKDGAGNRYYTKNSYRWLYYDGTDPGLVSNLQSSSHNIYSWSKDKTIDVTWSAASDSGGSELDGYSIEWSHSASTLPDTTKDDIEQNITNATSPSLADDNDWCFHIRSVDNAGNWDNTARHLGPFYIDTTPPSSSVTTLSEYKSANSFTVSWSGSDGPGCDIESYDVQYKDGNGAWTNWLTNTTLTSKTFGPTLPISVQDEHTYYFRCRAKDKLDNQESYPSSADTSTTIDLTPPNAPIVSSTSHKEDEWNKTDNDPLFNWTVPPDFSDIDGFSFKLNSIQNYTPDTVKDCEETTTSEQCIDVFDGIWYFHIRAKDNAGNWGATDTYGPVKIDLTAPAFPTISSSADPAKEGDITITVVASEQMSVLSASVTQNGKSPTLININSSDSITWTGIYTVVRGYDGTATISVSGEDLAGKPGSDLTTFLVDTIPPTKSEISSTTHPKNTPTSNSRPSFTWTDSADDGGSGVAGYSYALNQIESYDLDTAVETTSTSVSFTKPDGTWWFHLRAVDEAGNGSEIDRYKFIIDTTSPTFTAFSLKDPTKEGNVTINVQASEELKQAPTVNVKQSGQGSATTVAMNSSDNITWRGTYTVVTGYDGTAIINVSGVDLADNAGTGSGNFEVDTIAPTASISMSPTSPLKTGEFQIVLTLTDASSIPQKPSLTYTLSGGSLISVSLTGSDKSWSGSSYIDSTAPEGMAMFSFSATDVAGNRGITITAGKTFEIDTTIEASSGGTSSNSDGTMVNVPEDAFSQNVNIRITYPDPNLSEIREADNNIIDDKGIKPIKIGNLYREIVAVGDIYGNEIENSDKPVTISIPYPDEDQNGMVDGTTIEEETLRMFHLDETLKKWILVPNSQVDSTGNNVSAEISNFSIYTLMQLSAPSSLSEVFGYPNPCYVKKDGYVRISNIPLDAKHVKIYIYNVAGELVRILEEGDEIETQAGSKLGKWDGRNENNEMVASGIYIYLIKSEGSKKIEKIAIFW